MVPTRAIAALFMASGAASLLYQVDWMRMLIRVFGVTTLAVSTVVSAFMGGLALGSHFGGRRSRRGGAGLRLYAYLELAAAGAAVIATGLMAALPNFYAHVAAEGTGPSARTATRLILAALVLLPPTTLMGATLPILTRFVADREKKAGLSLAVLYGFNTLGAVLGVLFSGYVAIAFVGERSTVGLALVINLLCGLGALNLSRQAGEKKESRAESPARRESGGQFYLALFALSGFCALGLEVLWPPFSTPGTVTIKLSRVRSPRGNWSTCALLITWLIVESVRLMIGVTSETSTASVVEAARNIGSTVTF